jgi:hypothetical protein
MRKHLCPLVFLSLAPLIPGLAVADPQPVSVAITTDSTNAALAPSFLGLSYEMSMLLPYNGRYYFDTNDLALVNTFQTLGIKSLRVGANAVDDPRIAVPQEKDIDALFNFARAAGVKVIYSFRLKNGDPADSARLAAYIATHYSGALDCFEIGNEPGMYIPKFDDFFAQWKPHYDAILKAVPNATFDGPGEVRLHDYAPELARAMFADGHLAMASDHYYFLGSGRDAEKDPPASRARFLTNGLHGSYDYNYSKVGAVLAAQGVPYRMDEMNSCYNGGAKDSSDTYASTLWALDCTHWWAAHHLLGMNYHTGESLVGLGGTNPAAAGGVPVLGVNVSANYSAFMHQADGPGIAMRPQAYAFLAFTQGARGRPLDVKLQAAPALNFDAYAYHDLDGSIFVTLINKSYGDPAQPASVSLTLLPHWPGGKCELMDLVQKDGDVASKSGVTLGEAAIDSRGRWRGRWREMINGQWHRLEGNVSTPIPMIVRVKPASATILRFSPAK